MTLTNRALIVLFYARPFGVDFTSLLVILDTDERRLRRALNSLIELDLIYESFIHGYITKDAGKVTAKEIIEVLRENNRKEMNNERNI